MRERTKHRIGIAADAVGWTVAGMAAAGFFYAQTGSVYSVVAVAPFLALAAAVVVSPQARRYMHMQYPGGNASADPDVIGKYTLLQCELPSLVDECLAKAHANRTDIGEVKWQHGQWEAIDLERLDAIKVALFPSWIHRRCSAEETSSSARVDGFAIEGCLAAFWQDGKWRATPMLFVGSVAEAEEEIRELSAKADLASKLWAADIS